MVSISLENSKKLESTSKENQAINKALNEVAHETIEDFIGQVKTDLISYWFLTIFPEFLTEKLTPLAPEKAL